MEQRTDLINQVIEQSRLPSFTFRNFDIVSQQPEALPEQYRAGSVAKFFPVFIKMWAAIERVTGHRWKCTSYIRQSPSHRRAQAFDLAPDIADSAVDQYAVTHRSDPVLYKREALLKQLQQLKLVDFSNNGTFSTGIFIEPDHLHLQILAGNTETPTVIVKWGVLKPVYNDSAQRMKLPLLRQ